jgi:hypothetical protein
MKRSTLILLLIAAVAGVVVYYLEVKPGKPRDEEPDKTKPAFNFKREDLAAITITRGSETTNLEFRDNKWLITQPVNALADESVLNSLVGDLVSARIDQEFNPSGGDLKSYGLTEPAVKLELKLKNGQVHRVQLGSKDPLGSSVYAQIDGSQNVAILPSGVLTNSDKSLNDLRERSVVGATQYELSSVKLTNESGTYELAKKDADWTIKSPVEGPADEREVSSLLSDITSAKAAEIVSETSEDLSKYGLDKPRVALTTQLTTGGERTISLGSKVDDKYYAKASDRPQIFKVESSFYDKLNTGLATLRSKNFIKLNRDDLTRVQIKNPNLTLVAEKSSDGKWLVKEPADKKDKEAYTFKLFDPLETTATEVIDKPAAAVTNKLANPPVEARLTGKDGKTTVIKVSAADGDYAYVRVEGRPEVYKVPKSMLETLSFKIDEAVPSS